MQAALPGHNQAATVVAVVLAAGSGSRLGRPKALVKGSDGTSWLARAATAARQGGASQVYVVIGAEADAVRRAVPAGCVIVEAVEWSEGMGASLRAGIGAVAVQNPEADAVVVMLVDTPGVGAVVVRRLTAIAQPGALARASYDSEPGHPVLIGREHWTGVLEVAHVDRGARDYLKDHHVTLVECGDVGSGQDVDTPDLLDRWRASLD